MDKARKLDEALSIALTFKNVGELLEIPSKESKLENELYASPALLRELFPNEAHDSESNSGI